MLSNYKFSHKKIHDGLFSIKEDTANIVIGYVNKHPQEGGWFYIVQGEPSDFYKNKDDTIEALISAFLTYKFNGMANNAGIIGDNKRIIT